MLKRKLINTLLPAMLFLALLVLPIIRQQAEAEVLFSDGFESGDFSNWTGPIAQGGGNLSVSSGGAVEGNYKAVFGNLSEWGDTGGVYKTISVTSVHVRCYWKTISLFDSNTFNLVAIGIGSTNFAQWYFFVIYDFANHKWGVRAYTNGQYNNYWQSGTINMAADTWYCIEAELKQHTSNGTIGLWVDGSLLVNQTNLNTSGIQMHAVRVCGHASSDQDNVRTVYIDDAIISTEYIGVREDQPPTYSTIGNTCTLAGNLTTLYTLWSDDMGLSQYKVEHNNTGTFQNTTLSPFSDNPAWANVSITLNSTVDVTVRWRCHANDSIGQWNVTSWQDIATTVNRPPTIDSYYPPSNPTINEGESQEFNVTYSDPDLNSLTVQWYLNGTPTVTTDSYNFTADFDSAGIYNVTVVVSDGQLSDSHQWNLTVTNVVHDVAVTYVSSSKTVVGEGYCVNVTVTVENQGDSPEIFNVTAFVNSSPVGSKPVTLAAGDNMTLIFQWNTTGFALGNYTISITAHIVLGETDTADNTYEDGWVFVTIPGDADGDRDVDIYDIVRMAGAYGVSLPDPRYDPECDIDGDGDIDIYDIVIAVGNYGERW